MKNLLLIGAFALPLLSFGQEVISSQGDSYTDASGSIDFTIGETVIETVGDASNDLTQGFHQTNWNFVGIDDFDPSFEVKVYPNPVDDYLIITTGDYENKAYELYDANGKIIKQGMLNGEETTIDTRTLLPASYSIRINNEEEINLKTIKLIKIQ